MAIDHCIVFWCAEPASPVPIARFAVDAAGDGAFIYGKGYLEPAGAVAIDPLHLPLTDLQMRIERHADGSYGVMTDAGPNTWGMRLTSSIARKRGTELPASPVEWLLNSWHYGSGCLGFSPDLATPPGQGVLPGTISQLDARLVSLIGQFATAIEQDIDAEAIRLLAPGQSLGGLRPKTVVMHNGIEHIAKFGRQDDRFDVPTVEYATLRLAHAAGIETTDFELVRFGEKSVLLVERFDRTHEGKRIHYLSAKTLLNINTLDSVQQYAAKFSYAGIAEAIRSKGVQGARDSHALFRRMVFNIMVGNIDDHLRNHAVLMNQDGRLQLSPAFDLVPHVDAPWVPQSIGVGACGTASTMSNALSQAGRFLLLKKEACAIIEEVREVVLGWRTTFKDSGVSDSDMHLIAGCFDQGEIGERVQVVINVESSDDTDSAPSL